MEICFLIPQITDCGLYAVSSPTTDGQTIDTSIGNRIWNNGSSYIRYNNQSYEIVGLDNFQNTVIENSGVIYIAQVYEPAYIAFNPGNGNGVGGNYDTPGAMFEYGDTIRVEVDVGNYLNNNQTTITLPAENQLSTPQSIVAGDPKTYTIPRETDYNYVLKGWYNIATGMYYNVSSGPVTATIDMYDGNGNPIQNVFYADWEVADYDLGEEREGTEYNAVSTKSFVTTKIFDYNELANLTSLYVTQNGTVLKETWTDKTTDSSTNLSSFLLYNPTHTVGTIGNAIDSNTWNQTNQNADTAGKWNITSPSNVLLQKFFTENGTQLGVKYVGTGDYLFHKIIDADGNEYYEYDSSLNAASYNQKDSRFYVWDGIQYVSSSDGNTPGFLPFNDEESRTGTESTDGTYNYWFGMEQEIDFELSDNVGTTSKKTNRVINKEGTNTTDLIYRFSGDDDTWIFIDNVLVADLGGAHGPMTAEINFSTGEIKITDSVGNDLTSTRANTEALKVLGAGDHTIKTYYIERNGGRSDLAVKFNFNLNNPQTRLKRQAIETVNAEVIQVKKAWKNTNSWNRPETIEIALYENGEEVEKVTLSNSNNWSHTWNDLNEENEYYVQETPIENFDISYTYNTEDVTRTEINQIYSLESDEILIMVGNHALNSSLETTNFYISNGIIEQTVPDEVIWKVVQANGGYKLQNKATNQYLMMTDQININTTENIDNATVFNNDNNAENSQLHYYYEESQWYGYDIVIGYDNDRFMGFDSRHGGINWNNVTAKVYVIDSSTKTVTTCSILNTYNQDPEEIQILIASEIKITKNWGDTSADKRTNSVSVTLYDSNDNEIETVTLNDANNWTHTWKDLNPDVGYYIHETPIPGFQTAYTYEIIEGNTGTVATRVNSLDYKEVIIAYPNASTPPVALNGNMEATEVIIQNDQIASSSVTDDIVWRTIASEDGYKLQNKGTGKYIRMVQGTFELINNSNNASVFQHSETSTNTRLNTTDHGVTLFPAYQNNSFGIIYGNHDGWGDNYVATIYANQSQSMNSADCTITNTYVPSITIKKIDALTKEGIPGVIFTITNAQGKYYDSTGWKNEITAMMTDNYGNMHIGQLENGQYTITEIEAAPGYGKLKDPVTITVSNGHITMVNGTSAYIDENDPNSLTTIIENAPGFILPRTGGIGTPIYIITGCLIMLICVCFWKKKIKN